MKLSEALKVLEPLSSKITAGSWMGLGWDVRRYGFVDYEQEDPNRFFPPGTPRQEFDIRPRPIDVVALAAPEDRERVTAALVVWAGHMAKLEDRDRLLSDALLEALSATDDGETFRGAVDALDHSVKVLQAELKRVRARRKGRRGAAQPIAEASCRRRGRTA